MKTVDVIIVNFRTKELTVEAVKSVLNEPELREVFVVENGSEDGSLEYLQKAASEIPFTLIPEKNLGFGGGNNVAAARATAPYLFFLNSDAMLVPGGLTILQKTLEENIKIGIVAPAVYLSDGKTLQPDAQGVFPTPFNLITRQSQQRTESLQPDWVSGVAFLVRREEYSRLKGFDSRLFMYYEDIDLNRRYREAGLVIQRELSAKVIHLGGASKQSSLGQKRQYFQSQDTYLQIAGYLFLSRLLVKIMRSPYYLFGRLFLWK